MIVNLCDATHNGLSPEDVTALRQLAEIITLNV